MKEPAGAARCLKYAAAAAVSIVIFLVCAGRGHFGGSGPELFFLCGAGLRMPAEEIAGMFERETGITVRTDYAPSGVLLGRISVDGRGGDVFMPGEEWYVLEAEALGMVEYSATAACWTPVIMTARGNPENITGLDCLARPGLRLALADERTAAVGRVSREVFEKNNISLSDIDRNLVYEGAAVHDAAAAVDLGHADAAVVWGPVAGAYENSSVVAVPPEKNILSPVPIAVLSSSENKKAAGEFVDYILSEKGRAVFLRHHYGGCEDGGQVYDF